MPLVSNKYHANWFNSQQPAFAAGKGYNPEHKIFIKRHIIGDSHQYASYETYEYFVKILESNNSERKFNDFHEIVSELTHQRLYCDIEWFNLNIISIEKMIDKILRLIFDLLQRLELVSSFDEFSTHTFISNSSNVDVKGSLHIPCGVTFDSLIIDPKSDFGTKYF